MLYLGRWLPAMPEGCSWGYHWLYWPVRNLWVWSSNIRNFCIINVQYTPWTICHSFAVVRVGLNQLVLPPSQSLAAFQCSEVLDGQPRQCPTTETGQIDLHMWTEDTSLYCRCKKKMAWRVKEEESGGSHTMYSNNFSSLISSGWQHHLRLQRRHITYMESDRCTVWRL